VESNLLIKRTVSLHYTGFSNRFIIHVYILSPKYLSVKPSLAVVLSVGPLLSFEDFTSVLLSRGYVTIPEKVATTRTEEGHE
jgi:hypothetical protein